MHTKRTRARRRRSAVLPVAALLLAACATAPESSAPPAVHLVHGDDVAITRDGRKITYRALDRLLEQWTGRDVETLSEKDLSELRLRAARLLRGSNKGPWILDTVPTAPSAWHHSRESARNKARATNRPLLVDFTGTHSCLRCVRLRREILESPEFERWAADRCVLLRSSAPWSGWIPDRLVETDPALIREYRDHPAPAVLVLGHDGKVLARSGYCRGGPAPWIGNLEAKLEAPAAVRHPIVVLR